MSLMGAGGFNFSGGMHNAVANAAATSARSSARKAQSDVDGLRGEIERLLMITEALWLFLKDQHGYSDEDLIKQIAIIDMRDGKLDGRVAREVGEPEKCAKCGRVAGKKRQSCLYCGAAVVQAPFAR